MNTHKPATQAVWGGEEASLGERATQVPIFQSVSFGYTDQDEWQDVALNQKPGHIYSRNSNPTVKAFEEKLRQMEHAEAAVAFASGMAAVSNTLFTFLRPGERIVTVKDTYGGSNKVFIEFLPKMGVQVELCDTTDAEKIEQAISIGCKLLYLETPTNPTLKLQDIARLAAIAHSAGAIVVVDNTFATPINQLPLTLGADIVLHSASKYLGGHADALGGVIGGARTLVEQVYHYREITGACLDPFAAYLLLRGMKTLALRIERQNQSALTIASWLEKHPKIERVFYPGLPSHPQHALAQKQMRGFGGMLSFALKGDYSAVKTFLPKLKLAHRAANLGAVETVVGPPATTSHVECTADERAAMGIPEALVRYSTGIEDVGDLIDDLTQALAAI